MKVPKAIGPSVFNDDSFLERPVKLTPFVLLVAFFLIPFGLLSLYLLPALGVVIGIGDPLAEVLLLYSLIAICVFLFTCFIMAVLLQQYHADLSRPHSILAAKLVVILLFLSYAILAIDFGGFPLTRYLLEGGVPSLLRAEFAKEKTGLAAAALYLRSSVLKSVFPLALIILLGSANRKWFWMTLIVFTVLAISTFEKAIVIWVGAPLLICFFMLRDKTGIRMTFLWVFFVFSSAASIQIIAADRELLQASATPTTRNQVDYTQWNGDLGVRSWQMDARPILLADLSDISDYRLFLMPEAGSTGTIRRITLSIANRSLWIPFVTAYDALAFWHQRFGGELLRTRTNRHLAAMTGTEFVDLERELFRFQFGGGQDSLGNANFVYFVEAYMAFGLIGVVGFSALLGSCCGLLAATKNTAIIASTFVVAMSVLNASLISSFFSGGLALLMLFALVVPNWRKAR